MTDPETLERPWNTRAVYLRAMGMDRLVHDGDMMDNDRSIAPGPSGTIGPPRPQVSLESFPSRPETKLSAAQVDRVAGRYAIDGAPLVLEVERRGEKPFFSVPGPVSNAVPLHAASPLSFFFAGARFDFTTDGAGQVTAFSGVGPDGSPISGQRIPARQ